MPRQRASASQPQQCEKKLVALPAIEPTSIRRQHNNGRTQVFLPNCLAEKTESQLTEKRPTYSSIKIRIILILRPAP
jgi:hypothetical protein